MPRIDPEQLLNCLQVLLTPQGGILSKDEVQRLAGLMTKFSKKLVSKCIYVLILKSTDKQLLGSFMAEGGWNLIYMWLQDAHFNKNWPLVTEVLELLLVTPVDVERLKMNNLPKLVKSLTKRDDLEGIQKLAISLVDEWLKIVKDVAKAEAAAAATTKDEEKNMLLAEQESAQEEAMEVDGSTSSVSELSSDSKDSKEVSSSLKFKVALRDGKQVISKIEPDAEGMSSEDANVQPSEEMEVEREKKEVDERKKEKTTPEKTKHRNSSSSKSSSSNKDKDRSRDKSKSSSKSSSSSRDKDKDKERDKDKRDKHRSSSSSKHKSSSSSSKSSSSSGKDKKEHKEKQAEKDKDTLARIQPQILSKVGRIPRKNDEKSSDKKKEDSKKPSFSVEVRKNTEEKPKTVKIFHSKMRSTGLLEEAKPPPPRSTVVKKPVPAIPAGLPVKRSSPVRDSIPPPEKKSRLMEPPERPGAIKLIPPKPKPVLQESDIFMDALTASATMKKEPKKRKRKPSVTKEGSPPTSPTPTTPTSPTGNLKNITPANFYQDTLEAENDDDKDKENQSKEPNEKSEDADPSAESVDQTPVVTTRTDSNGLKGVLSHSKKKGPKRSIRWRPDSELVEIQYFELDETERVNVMKPFMDMARMEMTSERETLKSRKLQNEDSMDCQTIWRVLIEIDLPAPPAEIGSKSLEKDIQFAREKRVLQALYFHKVPDTPGEPEAETHPMSNPVTIPLDDPENPDPDSSVQPWPEPKGSPPHIPNVPPMFPNITAPPFMNMPGPPAGFPPAGMPPFPPNGFVPPNMMRPPGPDWNGMPPPNMQNMPNMPNMQNMPNMPPPDMMNQGPPNMFDNNNGGFGPQMPENGFPPPFGQPPNNGMPMFAPPNNFNMRGRGGFRRGGGGTGPWLRMAGPNSGPNQGWNGPRNGGPPNRGGRLCNNFKKFGHCRNGDNCHYLHIS